MQSAAKKIGFASPNRQTEEGFEGKEEKNWWKTVECIHRSCFYCCWMA